MLAASGSLFFHGDCREVHYCKVLLDVHLRARVLHQRDRLGLRLRRAAQAPLAGQARHHPLVREGPGATTPSTSTPIDRIPYMAPVAGGSREGRARKDPDRRLVAHDRAHHSGRRRPATPPRSRLGLLERIVKVHSSPGDRLLDFFAGSGTFGEAAAKHGRSCLLIDNNQEAARVMARRLAHFAPCHEGFQLDIHTSAEPQSQLPFGGEFG